MSEYFWKHVPGPDCETSDKNYSILQAERDALKARVERMEKALKDLMEIYRKNVVMEHSSQPTKNSDPEYFEAKAALEQGEGGCL